jgi:hypothetical protein
MFDAIDSATIKEVAGPIATVFAAAAAAFVAYRLGQSQIAVAKSQAKIAERNWQTANEKIVLELFERRLTIFEEIRSIVGEVTRTGAAPDDVLNRYSKAIDRVPYFFGQEVQAFVEEIRLRMIDLNLANTMMANPLGVDRSDWVSKRSDNFLKVTKFYQQAPTLFGPYMQAHQKVSPVEPVLPQLLVMKSG